MLAAVKSFLGSRGVVAQHVMGTGGDHRFRNLYLLLNDPMILRRGQLRRRAVRLCRRSGEGANICRPIRRPRKAHARAGDWRVCVDADRGRRSPIEVYGLPDVIQVVRKVAGSKTHRDNPVLVTMKVLDTAGLLADTDTSGVTTH